MTPSSIKALVIRSPWAQQITAGTKAVEHRTWLTHYRGLLAIVAARRPESGTDAGRAVCLVRLTDCVEAGHRDYEWLLAGPMPMARRVEVPGRLGLFELTGQLAADVWAAAVVNMATSAVPVRRRAEREIHQFLQRG